MGNQLKERGWPGIDPMPTGCSVMSKDRTEAPVFVGPGTGQIEAVSGQHFLLWKEAGDFLIMAFLGTATVFRAPGVSPISHSLSLLCRLLKSAQYHWPVCNQ